jgi:hypothetical protein
VLPHTNPHETELLLYYLCCLFWCFIVVVAFPFLFCLITTFFLSIILHFPQNLDYLPFLTIQKCATQRFPLFILYPAEPFCPNLFRKKKKFFRYLYKKTARPVWEAPERAKKNRKGVSLNSPITFPI